MQQLTIFDVMYDFDESKANFKELAEFKFCYVLALIPQDVLFPMECKHRLYSDEWNINQKRWSGYVWAIHAYNGFKRSHEQARELFKRHRDSQEPITLEVCLNHEFRPDHVVEYL